MQGVPILLMDANIALMLVTCMAMGKILFEIKDLPLNSRQLLPCTFFSHILFFSDFLLVFKKAPNGG